MERGERRPRLQSSSIILISASTATYDACNLCHLQEKKGKEVARWPEKPSSPSPFVLHMYVNSSEVEPVFRFQWLDYWMTQKEE